MPQAPKLGLPLRYRRQALARLDTLIAAAERDRGERQAAAERGTRGAKGTWSETPACGRHPVIGAMLPPAAG
jgi:hypothetical protein